MSLLRTDYTVWTNSTAAASTSGASSSFTIPNGELVVVIGKMVNDFNNEDPNVLSLTDSLGATPIAITSTVTSGLANAYESAIRAWYFVNASGSSRTFTLGSNVTHGRQWALEVYSYTGFDPTTQIGGTGTKANLATDGADSITLSASSSAGDQAIGSAIMSMDTGPGRMVPANSEITWYGVDSWYIAETQVYAGAIGSLDWSDTDNDTGTPLRVGQGIAFAVKAAAATVTVTDVDTDETITSTQTNIVVTCTGASATQGSSTLQIIQGSVTKSQTAIDSWSDTSIQFDLTFDS